MISDLLVQPPERRHPLIKVLVNALQETKVELPSQTLYLTDIEIRVIVNMLRETGRARNSEIGDEGREIALCGYGSEV